MIPENKIAAVTRGLREAFGVTECEHIAVLKNLPSSMVFRMVVRGEKFLLKISLRTNDPARHYACMNAAAEAGLAPRVRYASVADRISITDFVATAPLPARDALVLIPAALRRLHALKPFPGVPGEINTSCTWLLNKGDTADSFIQNFKAAGILPAAQTEDLLACHGQLAAACSQRDPVSSHNDLFKPDNILFDGSRLWLIDWEAAFLNDRYADLAVAANLVVTDDQDEDLYLRTYFGQPPDPYQRARFFLMRQLAHLFYGMVYLLMGAAGSPLDCTAPAPEFEDVQRRIWAGEADLTEKSMKAVYGRVHWERLSRNLREPRFKESLKIVSEEPRAYDNRRFE